MAASVKTKDKKIPHKLNQKRKRKDYGDGNRDQEVEVDDNGLSDAQTAKFHSSQQEKIAKEPKTIEAEQETAPSGDLEAFPDLSLESSQAAFVKLDSSAGLPEWLRHPIILDANEPILFSDLAISSRLLSRLRQEKLEFAFAVQAKVWNLLKEPGDLCICAPTGSGKTLSYGIPALSSRTVPRIRALILVPTKELVMQIHRVMEFFAGGSGLLVGTFGIKSFVTEQESFPGLDIVITTPGRLVSHIESTPFFSLQHLQYLIIDEADRLLHSRFQNWVAIVISAIHSPSLSSNSVVSESFLTLFDDTILSNPHSLKCRKMIFSATQTRNLESLTGLKLSFPRMIISDVRMKDDDLISYLPSTLCEKFYRVSTDAKPLHLFSLLQNQPSVLVFAKSTDTASRLHKLLSYCDIQSGLYSSDNASRKPLLSKFSGGSIHVLICTDLMARGIDLQVQRVINYDLPRDIGQYVHRVGRTARAGKDGLALTLVEKGQEKWVEQSIVNGIGRSNEVEWADGKIDERCPTLYKEAMAKLKVEILGGRAL
ncbi:ATP-dependent RNA helicase dbp6 [Neolecta irregularis DAH-3]|uniref:ATP-dependent RNA helicase n=1 Tax=Neolecta irregularis (strain DAH-3) TaxID=1198029 RepID=A0A1U7LVG4_NEOID|nr:ATP-dependent RNA helicase dbp6 [Neolecta irregularis DAH-3]|eukprot:OLL26563.1 ATP-dependent RNA helicase dbp6 [Neolecta irregularis DAH-3]